MGLTIPDELRTLLREEPELESTVLQLVARSEAILRDNKTPFFPAYTDHGTDHVQRVLDAAVKLIPKEVWRAGLLGANDAAVLIGAALLHDMGMHVQEGGFLELVGRGSKFRPVPWFDQDHGDRRRDAEWPELWDEFRLEARHFTATQIDILLGPKNAGIPAIAYGDADRAPDRWTAADRLLVGEFLRRHHGRLSHEIAGFGFPGAGDEYPALGGADPELADAVGVVARSHAETLRLMLAYLDYRWGNKQQPADALLPYLMGLLRVADYLQIDAARAPTVLLRMKQPQSRQSIDEWKKHRAVARIVWRHDDPFAISINVSPQHELRTHLQLRELFTDLQRELDTTVAVLSELYATEELAALRLARQRIHTNLDEKGLHDKLPYVPRRAGLRSADDLFRLVISDLYGDVPVVAGRELLQNAVDAVRERWRWEDKHGTRLPPDAFRDQAADVLVEIAVRSDDEAVLRVSDRGVGMTPDTVIDHYLRAGSSLRPTPSEYDAVDRDTAIRWMRAGRFGVGAFAAFLLGSEIRVHTRHVSEKRGVEFTARLDGDLVRLDWADMPCGTEVAVTFSPRRLRSVAAGRHRRWAPYELLESLAGLYRLAVPAVSYLVFEDDARVPVAAVGDVPLPDAKLSDGWHLIQPPGFDAVLWRQPTRLALRETVSAYSRQTDGAVTHNGILIRRPDEDRARSMAVFSWASAVAGPYIRRPELAVFDSRHALGVSLTRYSLTTRVLPFQRELLAAIGIDLAGWAFAAGARQHPLGLGSGLAPLLGRTAWLPLLPRIVHAYVDGPLCVLWVTRQTDRRDLTRFTTRLAAAGWRQLPWRAPLPVEWSGLSNDDTRGEYGFAVPDIETSADHVRALTGRAAVASVAVRRRRTTRMEGVVRRDEPEWRYHGRSLERWVDAGEQPDGVAEVLIAVATEILRSGNSPAIGLTLLGPTRADVPGDTVSETWQRVVQGPVARAARDRQSQLAEVAAREPAIGEAAAAWQRRLAKRHP